MVRGCLHDAAPCDRPLACVPYCRGGRQPLQSIMQFTPTDQKLAARLRGSRPLRSDCGYVDTLYVTQQIGTFGLGNRPGHFDFNSGPIWPYGRRIYDVSGVIAPPRHGVPAGDLPERHRRGSERLLHQDRHRLRAVRREQPQPSVQPSSRRTRTAGRDDAAWGPSSRPACRGAGAGKGQFSTTKTWVSTAPTSSACRTSVAPSLPSAEMIRSRRSRSQRRSRFPGEHSVARSSDAPRLATACCGSGRRSSTPTRSPTTRQRAIHADRAVLVGVRPAMSRAAIDRLRVLIDQLGGTQLTASTMAYAGYGDRTAPTARCGHPTRRSPRTRRGRAVQLELVADGTGHVSRARRCPARARRRSCRRARRSSHRRSARPIS